MSRRAGLPNRRALVPWLTLALAGWPCVDPASAARRLFSDPVQVIPQLATPVQVLHHTFPDGARRLLVTDANRRVQVLDPAGADPWQPLRVVEMDGDPDGYNPGYGSRLLLADVNGDDVDDMILDTRPVFVAPGRPDGSYAAPFAWEMPVESMPLIVQDVDGDGHVDLARFRYHGDRLVSYRAGRGDGRFRSVAEGIPVPPETYLFATDMTGDGLVDLLRMGKESVGDSLHLVRYVADGAGGFVRRVTSPLLPEIELVVGLADMDGDDEPDLVTLDYQYDDSDPDTILIPGPIPIPVPRPSPTGYHLAVHPGLGDGHFAHPLESVASERADELTLADVDGDGRLDVLTHDDGHLVVYRNRGDSRLEPRVELAMTTGSGVPHLQDFDGDGANDILVVASRSFRLLTHADIERFPVPPSLEVPFATSKPLMIDVNGDGWLDLVGVGQEFRVSVRMFTRLGQPDGSLGDIRVMSFPEVVEEPRDLQASDLDGDGDLDLLGSFGYNDLRGVVFENDGSGGFTAGPPRVIGLRGEFPPRFIDLDGDGRDELLGASWKFLYGEDDSTSLDIIRVSATGEVTPLAHVALDGRLEGFLPADLDGDGRLELIAWSRNYRDTDLRILHRTNGFTYEAGPLESLPYDPDDILPGDWLPEPGVELVMSGNGALSIVAREAGGGWTIRQVLSDQSPESIDLVPDMNGDGRPELGAHAHSSDYPFKIYLSNDVTGFADGIEVPFASRGDVPTVADVDHDGWPDMLYYESRTRLAIRHGLPIAARAPASLTAGTDDWTVTLDWSVSNSPAGMIEIWRAPMEGTTAGETRLDPGSPASASGHYTDTAIRTAGRYRYRLVHRDVDGYGQALAGIEVEVHPDPGPIRLLSVARSPGPGPFRLSYEVRAGSRAVLEIFTVTGRRLARQDFGVLPPSRGELAWDGRGDDGRPAASGIYFARLSGSSSTLRLVLLR